MGSFQNVASRAVCHSLNHALKKVVCAGNIIFCAVINVLTKHSV